MIGYRAVQLWKEPGGKAARVSQACEQSCFGGKARTVHPALRTSSGIVLGIFDDAECYERLKRRGCEPWFVSRKWLLLRLTPLQTPLTDRLVTLHMALQPPNSPTLAQHMTDEFQFIQNAPENIPNPLSQVQQQLAQIQQTQRQMLQTQQQMQQKIDRVQEQLNQSEMLSRIKFYNTSTSLTSPLVFPPLLQGVNLSANHPKTKCDLMRMDAHTCQALANAFGLPALPAGAPLQLLRQ